MTENGEWNNTLDYAHLTHIGCFICERIVKIDLKAFDKHKEKRYSYRRCDRRGAGGSGQPVRNGGRPEGKGI